MIFKTKNQFIENTDDEIDFRVRVELDYVTMLEVRKPAWKNYRAWTDIKV